MRQLPVLRHMLFFFCILCVLTSCVNTKPHTYFNDLKNNVFADTLIEPAIQKNDLLSISVTSLNPEATEVFNKPNESVIAHSSGNGVSAITTGYLVDQSGHINFPILGAFKAEGLTLEALADSLSATLDRKKLLVGPIVNVRLMNFRVTVLGEVARPTVVTSTSGRLSFLEALGMAGDLTLYSKRDNILLIRIENGKKIIRRLDLTSPDFVASSEYYYLKTNDVIYVEANKNRIGSATALRQTLPAILSGLSFLAIIIDRLTR
ncbi:MAG: sugar transporter [Chitinophagaceae bacterium]|nr:sugar transporter [Chitinophagaceae bacterium]